MTCYVIWFLEKLLRLIFVANILIGLTTQSLLTALCVFEFGNQIEVFLVTNLMGP